MVWCVVILVETDGFPRMTAATLVPFLTQTRTTSIKNVVRNGCPLPLFDLTYPVTEVPTVVADVTLLRVLP